MNGQKDRQLDKTCNVAYKGNSSSIMGLKNKETGSCNFPIDSCKFLTEDAQNFNLATQFSEN